MAKAINPYLHFKDSAEEAFKFYKSVFGGEFTTVQRYKDAPGMENVTPEEREKILHISLPIGKGNVLMASDTVKSMGWPLNPGNNFSLSVNAANKEEADRLLKGLSAGGKVTMPMADQFWGAYFGMCTDKFGIQWMVSYDERQQ